MPAEGDAAAAAPGPAAQEPGQEPAAVAAAFDPADWISDWHDAEGPYRSTSTNPFVLAFLEEYYGQTYSFSDGVPLPCFTPEDDKEPWRFAVESLLRVACRTLHRARAELKAVTGNENPCPL